MRKLISRQVGTFLVLFLLLGSVFAGSAQTGTVSGKVSAGDASVGFASVALSGTAYGTSAMEDGSFVIDGVVAGMYELHVRLIGYTTFRKTIEVKAGQTTSVEATINKDMLNLEQFVVTGTRSEVPVYDSPVIVNKIDSRTFEATQSLSLAEGLNFSPGLRVETNCQNCGFTQLRMNGMEGAYSQILINSRPIFSALAGVYGLDMIPPNMIDRIEVVKGGGSVMYGGSAIAGTVNIITKDPISNSFEIGYNQSFTDFEAPDRVLSFSGSIVSDDMDKGISLYGMNRDRQQWDANGDGFSELTMLQNNTFGFDAFFDLNQRNKLKLNGHSIREFRRGGNKFDLAPHQTDVTEQLDHRILGAGLSFEHFSRNYRHKVSVYVSSQFTDRDSYYGGGGRVLGSNDSLTDADRIAINAYGKSKDVAAIGGVQYSYEIRDDLVLLAGSEYSFNDVIDEMPGYDRVIDQQVGTLGNYAQLEWDPIQKLCLLVGGRYDLVDINGRYDLAEETFFNKQNLNVLVPRFTAMYDIRKDVKARFSFAQGYRAPQAFDEDLHIETVGGAARFIRLSPDLETERSNSITASLNYTKIAGKTQSNIVLEGFYTQLQNPFILSDQEELPSGVAVIEKRNGENAIVQGVNLEVNFAYSSLLLLQVGGTFQTARYSQPETIWEPQDETSPLPATVTENILRTPNAYGFFTVTVTPIKPLNVSWSGVVTGPMDVQHIVDVENEYTVIEKSPSFFENNVKASYEFQMRKNFALELYAGVQNMFNSFQKDFDSGINRDAGYVYGPTRPRTGFAGVKLRMN